MSLCELCENSEKVGESKLDSGMTNPSFHDDTVQVENETMETQDEVVKAPQVTESPEVIQVDSGFDNIVFDMSPKETVSPEETTPEQVATDNLLDDLI